MVARRLLSPADVRRLLDRHGLAPRRARGQNFVVDQNTVRKVVRDAGVARGELVCEIGPGLGSLTLALLDAGARVVAVEIDSGLVRALRDVLAGEPDVRVIEADAVGIDYAAATGGEPAALVANLPYNVATPIVLEALSSGQFTRALVMVQREVGERWTATVGHPRYGAVSVKLSALAEARIVASVSRRAFYPVPNVDSVTVRFAPRPWALPVARDALFALVERGFAQRRKLLRNALASASTPPAAVEAALLAAGLPAGVRAEELDLAAWGALANALGGP